MTVLYSILHFLVDGMCAMAMFGKYISREDGYFYILLYNFCAFALQMPFGAALDLWSGKKGKPGPAFCMAVAGVLCTMAGAALHPVLLGVGNALFHVGGGVGTVCEDHASGSRGARLGVFVAPGALGLYLGSLIAKGDRTPGNVPAGAEGFIAGTAQDVCRQGALDLGKELNGRLFGAGVVMLLLLGAAAWKVQNGKREDPRESRLAFGGSCGKEGAESCGMEGAESCGKEGAESGGKALRLAVCCLLVVILRSYIGMAVSFPWKTGILKGLLGVTAVVGGKAAGGLFAARYGSFRTAAVSLLLAAACYLFSSSMPMGLAALFLFNMTMPVTLYWMVCGFPQTPGFAFGFLTFGLFLGFLPAYFAVPAFWSGGVLGSVGSVLSLLLLAAGLKRVWKRGTGWKAV